MLSQLYIPEFSNLSKDVYECKCSFLIVLLLICWCIILGLLDQRSKRQSAHHFKEKKVCNFALTTALTKNIFSDISFSLHVNLPIYSTPHFHHFPSSLFHHLVSLMNWHLKRFLCQYKWMHDENMLSIQEIITIESTFCELLSNLEKLEKYVLLSGIINVVV